MRKKVIGVVDKFVLDDNAQYLREGQSNISYNYMQSVRLGGGLPLILPVAETKEEVVQQLEMVDGILFTGGVDVNPLFFRQQPIMQLGEISEYRDMYELMLCKEATERRIPILGICRGLQLINVALGGTLIQDIGTQCPDCFNHRQKSQGSNVTHDIRVERGSIVYELLREKELAVNSFHHQATDDIAEGLWASAYASDGIIEALEGKNQPILAVQWHPEMMTVKHAAMVELFSWLVNIS